MFGTKNLKLKIETLEKEKSSLVKTIVQTVACFENKIKELENINLELEMSNERLKKIIGTPLSGTLN